MNGRTGRTPRRAVLAGGAALGLTVLSSGPSAGLKAPGRLVLDYRPSRPTGWPEMPGQPGTTLGGHVAAREFRFNGASHRVSLLPFGQPGNAPDPVYADLPVDPDVDFRRTLAAAFGAHYSICYTGDLPGVFVVQSYSVYAVEATGTDPQTAFGCNLFVVYRPRGRADDTLQWIQVVHRADATGVSRSEVDNLWRANPYYLNGGLTSVYGTEIVSFNDAPRIMVQGDIPLDGRFVAEAFLVRDTGRPDATGKPVITVYGGLRWGWQVRRLQP